MLIFPSYFVGPPKGYEIEQSLRFDGSSYLNLSGYGQNPTDGYRGTLSIWVKHDDKKNGGDGYIITATRSGSTSNLYHERNSTTGFEFVNLGVFGGENPSVRTAGKYRDYSAWYHVVVQYFNDTGANVNNGYKMWINGVQEDSVRAGGWSVQNNWAVTENATSTRQLGRSGSAYFSGYMAECHCIDGQIIAPTDFGEYDDNGVWRPIEYDGTHGNNGWYLKFDPTATNGVGHDHSGNGHHFTSHGFTTSGAGTDVMSDSPTANYATFNPLDHSQDMSGSFYLGNSNLNLSVTNNSAYRNLGATFSPEGQKGYFEITWTAGSPNFYISFMPTNRTSARHKNDYQYTGRGHGLWSDGNVKEGVTNVWTSYLSSFGSSDTLQIAFDFTNGNRNVWFGRNNTWGSTSGGTGNPATGANPALTATQLDSPQAFSFAINTGAGTQTIAINFGQRAFEYTPPTGYKSLNTGNMPRPTVKDGSENFSANLWSGNNTTNTALTGFGHAPDLTWIKARNYSFANVYFDSIRGGSKRLYNTGTTPPAQDTNTEYLKSFDSDGITLGSDANVNYSTANYVGHSWKGGGTVSAGNNTDGDITTTVSANTTAGFSVIKYTSSGTAGDSIGHGLNDAPAFFIIKNIDASDHYAVYHQGIGNTKALLLNSANNVYTGSVWWNNTSPTSTVITLGSETSVNNTSSDDYICWAWAEVEGYSKFGYYVASGQTFVYTGFSPAFVMIKALESANWVIFDSKRSPYNKVDEQISANSAAAEVTNDGDLDFLSNGFKLLSGAATTNAYTYVYAAFAEHPYGGSGVSPATAR